MPSIWVVYYFVTIVVDLSCLSFLLNVTVLFALPVSGLHIIHQFQTAVVTQNENDNENLKSSVVNLKKEIHDEYDKLYRLSDVLIKVLFYKAQLNNKEFGYHYNTCSVVINELSESLSPDKIYQSYYDFFLTYN
ncbi:uncharacterized protein LOC126910127 [Daktulosphaira vitifoliae]|uniref:uncharacterized protein LOC126910127 n=1 Tax=Daktulosphaira vitifoliae TaxID=58002 RepID=UPI0021AA2E36|nr:uncharacterized protein LOC126910127 [Daktulosphaira vitifoliae]